MGINSIKAIVFTSSGSYTPSSGTRSFIVVCQGAGGGGGGAYGNLHTIVGVHGSAGGYSRKAFTCNGGSYDIQVGSAGSGGVAPTGTTVFTPGGNGGDTIFHYNRMIASGGKGSTSYTDLEKTGTTSYLLIKEFAAGSDGGNASGGDINISGESSSPFSTMTRDSQSNGLWGPMGAGSILGSRTPSVPVYSASGQYPPPKGFGYGSGGAGACDLGNSSYVAGGDGAPGIVIITEYIE